MTSLRTLKEVLQSTSDALFPEKLGDKKVKIDSVNCDGDTPLHVLIWRNNTEGALLLIKNGADVNAVGEMGETPLHVAISQGNKRLVKALLSAGAKKDVISEFGKTPAGRATDKGIALDEYT